MDFITALSEAGVDPSSLNQDDIKTIAKVVRDAQLTGSGCMIWNLATNPNHMSKISPFTMRLVSRD